MRKRISNKEAAELADKGKAAYKKGGKPKAIKTVEDSFNEAQKSIEALVSQLGGDISDGNKTILNACSTILESMNLYHEAVLVSLADLPKPEKQDNRKMKHLDDRILAILRAVTEEKPAKEWEFNVVRDWKGSPDTITAKEIKH